MTSAPKSASQHFAHLAPSSRVWVYQARRPFTSDEGKKVCLELEAFARQWVSHNEDLHAAADLVHDRFVVLMVDESQAGASGCSIDSSVHFLKTLQTNYGTDLFDRTHFTYRGPDGKVCSIHQDDFAGLYAAGELNDDTLVFDTLVTTKADWESGFEKPLGQSWHRRLV